MTSRVLSRRKELLPLFAGSDTYRPARTRGGEDLLAALRRFSFNGAPTAELTQDRLRYLVNEFWTSGQRQAHSLHEISYRACFKPQLPEFFISRLTDERDTVYDPFSGRGTTGVQAGLMGRRPAANDVNPLSEILTRPRLEPPSFAAVQARFRDLDLTRHQPTRDELDLLVFYGSYIPA